MKNITIPREKVLERRGVKFLQAVVEKTDPLTRTVYTSAGEYTYDQLVIATGPKVNYDIAPGMRANACYIGTPDGAMKTREKLEAFKADPGPIVIGATQQAGCMVRPMNSFSTSRNGSGITRCGKK